MIVKTIKGINSLAVIPLDFICSRILVGSEKDVKKSVTNEYIRTCNLLELNASNTINSFTIESMQSVNYSVNDFPLSVFDGITLTKRQIKDYKTLYLQNAFYFKSLTDNLTDNNREISVNAFISTVESVVNEFDGTVGGGGLMETAFNAFSFADVVKNQSAFLLSLIAKTTMVAKTVYFKYGSPEHDPFLFSSEF